MQYEHDFAICLVPSNTRASLIRRKEEKHKQP